MIGLIHCLDPMRREKMYANAERDWGKGFADYLRETIEPHHLIMKNERDIRST